MAGVAGRLTPSAFGFAMPVTDPPFDHPPARPRGCGRVGRGNPALGRAVGGLAASTRAAGREAQRRRTL